MRLQIDLSKFPQDMSHTLELLDKMIPQYVKGTYVWMYHDTKFRTKSLIYCN